MQKYLILGNQKRVQRRKARNDGKELGTHDAGGGRVLVRKVRQEMAGGICSRRARRGRKRGKLHNNA